MQCAKHPNVETELACGKCGTPICPRCMHHTPVGARCRTCAGIRRLPTYNVPPAVLVRGVGAGIVAGVLLGGVWGLLLPLNFLGLFSLLAALGLGYLVGEAVAAATNRRAGPPLQAAAVAGVVVAYLIRTAILASSFRDVGLFELLRTDLFGYIAVALASWVAVSRLR